MNNIIRHKSTLKKLQKIFNIVYCECYGYIIDSANIENDQTEYKKLLSIGYDLKYFDGCFYPFITKRGILWVYFGK